MRSLFGGARFVVVAFLFVVVALRLALTRGVAARGLLSVGVGRHGVGEFNFSLGVKFG